MKTLKEIEADVARLAEFVGAAEDELPTYGSTRDFGYPHVEVWNHLYHYVVVERGQELERRSTSDYGELLYWIFSSVTHSLAFSYELNHRIEGQDCRRIAFPKQIELMKRISPQMAQRLSVEISNILRRAPYKD